MPRDTGGKSPAIDVDATVAKAWASLPEGHRRLLEVIGAHQYCVVSDPLGVAVDGFRRSAGLTPPLTNETKQRLAGAFGVWIRELKVVLINGSHPDLLGLDQAAAEAFVAHLAWHEWGHALSIERCTPADVFNGRGLLDLCPPGIRDDIRGAGYGPGSYTHEIVAEVYALLMERLKRGEKGRPPWLNGKIYALVQRVTGWME